MNLELILTQLSEQRNTEVLRLRRTFSAQDWRILITAWANRCYDMPELVIGDDMHALFGYEMYSALGIKSGNPGSLLQSLYADYGVMNLHKADVYLERKDQKSRKRMGVVFFSQRQKKENALLLLKRCYETIWQPTFPLPEAVRGQDILSTLGRPVLTAYGLTVHDGHVLMARMYPDYLLLTPEKAEALVCWDREYDEVKIKRRMHTSLFIESPHALENIKVYKRIYQQLFDHNPRLELRA